MNTLQYIESIQQVFPNLSRNQIRLDLDTAQKLFADETGTILIKGTLSNPTTNVAWSLPSGFVRLKSFIMYDSSNNPVYAEEKNYTYEIDLDKFYVFSNTSTPITGLDCTYAYIIYEGLPDTLSTESTDMDVTEHYRDAIESYVLAKYFGKFPIDFVSGGQVVKALNLQAANLHENRYEKLRVKTKRLFNSREKTDNNYRNYDHAGSFYLPKKNNDTTSSTTTVSVASLSQLYTKYAYYKIPYPGVVADAPQTAVLSIGYSTIACSLTGNAITITSTGEFDEETIILVNNWDATWVRNSSSEIVITAPAGWTTISFEIYERS